MKNILYREKNKTNFFIQMVLPIIFEVFSKTRPYSGT